MDTVKKCITPREKYSLDNEYLINKKFGSYSDLNIYEKFNCSTYDEYVCLTHRKHIKKYIKDKNQNDSSFIFFLKVLFCCE